MSTYTKDNPGREYIARSFPDIWEEDSVKYLSLSTNTHMLTMSSADKGETIDVAVSLAPQADPAITPTLSFVQGEDGDPSIQVGFPPFFEGARDLPELRNLVSALKETVATAERFETLASDPGLCSLLGGESSA